MAEPDPAEAAQDPLACRELQALVRQLDAAAAGDCATLQIGGDGQDGPAPDRPLNGLAAALRVTAWLLRHRCGWADVLIEEPALAKLCGRLGSAFDAEQEAAYVHALRYLVRHRRSWSTLIRMPAALGGVPGQRLLQDVATPRGQPGAAPWAEIPVQPCHPPPEGDWATTVAWLIEHRAWRVAGERTLLDGLAAQLAAGEEINDADAVWLRELWWQAELLAAGSSAAAE